MLSDLHTPRDTYPDTWNCPARVLPKPFHLLSRGCWPRAPGVPVASCMPPGKTWNTRQYQTCVWVKRPPSSVEKQEYGLSAFTWATVDRVNAWVALQC